MPGFQKAKIYPGQPVDGKLVSLPARDAIVDTLYLDSTRTEEWLALAQTNTGMALVFGAEWMFLPPVLGT